MLLEISHREREGIEILDLNGRLVLGQEDLEFRNELDQLVKAGKTRITLNLSDVKKLDTAGIGTLIFAQSKLRDSGGNLAVFITKPSRMDPVTEAHLETVFGVFRDEQDAINSFFPDRQLKQYDLLEFARSSLNN
jgi:anti-sigma B factor antagonist